MIKLTDSLTVLPGVGDAVAQKFQAVGITNIAELLDFLPRTYNDYSQITPIAKLKPGNVTLEATISQVSGRYVRRGMHITEAIARDKTGSVRIVWFNQPYRAKWIRADVPYFLSGDFQLRRQRFSLLNPAIEQVSELPVHTARIVPVYRESAGVKSIQMRKLIQACQGLISSLPESLPPEVVQENKLMSRAEAIEQLHFPSSSRALETARHRYGFEEVFQLTLAALLNKYELLRDKAVAVPFDDALAKQFVANLPFTLTDDQRKAAWRIYQDMGKSQPMNRLLEGDVGSGKTVVATMAAVMAMKQGFQVAFMAPTEILARQHGETIAELLQPLGMENKLGLLIGSTKPKAKKLLQEKIKKGEVAFIVGTHALIADKVSMRNLGLVIVDEQHRFGVEQRKKLQQKAGHMPHVLHMTATPIPRSLALTLYGELDISLLSVKPAGRKPVETTICSPNSRAQLYAEIAERLKAGRQLFVVCPLIEDSEVLDAQSVTSVYERLSKKDLKSWRIGLLHGKQSSDEKAATMEAFLAHKIDVLVTTTVIEVGVHVPNATMMLIESAERFGLAQIHQLRGRVGRSDVQSYCYLMLSDSKQPSRRLRALASSNDGFALAELDLEIRGPGSIYGTFQHGALDLRVASLTDTKLIAAARESAQNCIDSGVDLLQYTELYRRVASLRAVTNLN